MSNQPDDIDYDAPAGLPYLLADLEQLSRDMTSLAVGRKMGVLLDMSGFLDHALEHLHDIREALGFPRVDLTVEDILDEQP